jgi:hypothetical protein
MVTVLDEPALTAAAQRLRDMIAGGGVGSEDGRWSIGAKVAHAHMIRSVAGRGCAKCRLVGD